MQLVSISDLAFHCTLTFIVMPCHHVFHFKNNVACKYNDVPLHIALFIYYGYCNEQCRM